MDSALARPCRTAGLGCQLGQAAATDHQDIVHRTWELRFPAGTHEIRRATAIHSDIVRSTDLVELRRASAESAGLQATRTGPLSRPHQGARRARPRAATAIASCRTVC